MTSQKASFSGKRLNSIIQHWACQNKAVILPRQCLPVLTHPAKIGYGIVIVRIPNREDKRLRAEASRVTLFPAGKGPQSCFPGEES
jgi:hypothetical protein